MWTERPNNGSIYFSEFSVLQNKLFSIEIYFYKSNFLIDAFLQLICNEMLNM